MFIYGGANIFLETLGEILHIIFLQVFSFFVGNYCQGVVSA